MGTISVGTANMIVPTLQRGNASQDALRPLLNAMQSFTGCMLTRSDGHDQAGKGSLNLKDLRLGKEVVQGFQQADVVDGFAEQV